MKQTKPDLFFRIGNLHALTKLIASLAIAIAVFFIVRNAPDWPTHFMIGWNSFTGIMIILSWITFFTLRPQEIRAIGQEQDQSRIIIFSIVVFSTIASLTTVFLLLTKNPTDFQLLVGISGMLLSWVLIHTIFALRYAHLYYGNDKDNKQLHAEGLEFPKDKKPDYLDFAYFSFVLGMTFQVSDVQVTSKRLRRLALMHGMISFLFNTFIVALTINVIAGLREGGS